MTDIIDLGFFVIHGSKLFTTFWHNSFHITPATSSRKIAIDAYYLLFGGVLANQGPLLCIPRSHSYNIIKTVQVFFLCAIGLFVHLLFSVCHPYNDTHIVKHFEQVKITLIVLANHVFVHGYLIIVLGTLKATCSLTKKYPSLVTENSICA